MTPGNIRASISIFNISAEEKQLFYVGNTLFTSFAQTQTGSLLTQNT